MKLLYVKLSEINIFYNVGLISLLLSHYTVKASFRQALGKPVWLRQLAALCLVAHFFFPSPTFAFVSSKDIKGLHERFDKLESIIENLRKNNEQMKLNFNSEINSLHVELIKIYGLAEVNYLNLSESLKTQTNVLAEELKKIREFNQSHKEILQKNFQMELEKITSKIADLASIYKTSTQEEMNRDNIYNEKIERINTLISQLIQIYKNTAVEGASRQDSLMANFNNQFGTIKKNISQLINIYKQSISTVAASNKDNSSRLKKQLTSIDSKIKKLTEIYKATIKESNATFGTISKNLSKELQLINKKLSNLKSVKSSATKKSPAAKSPAVKSSATK